MDYLHYGLPVFSWVITLVYIVLQGHKQRWFSLVSLVLTFAIFYFARNTLNIDTLVCLLLALFVSYIVNINTHTYNEQSTENFENPELDNDENDENEDVTEETKNAYENTDKKTDDAKKSSDKPDSSENINFGQTFLEAYKNLTPDQLHSMTKDAKDLIKTQHSLVETIKTLAPVVIEGRKMLENFKDYFGTDKNIIKNVLGK